MKIPAAGRIAIVFDGHAWFVRAIRSIEHDLDRNEKVYRCDRPIGFRYKSLAAAVRSIRWKPTQTRRPRRAA